MAAFTALKAALIIYIMILVSLFICVYPNHVPLSL